MFKLFIGSTIGFVVVYCLRGFGLLSWLPGGLLLFLLLISLGSGITWGIIKTRRY